MQNEEGFTLLEMLLVMVVITILLLLIIPNVVTQALFIFRIKFLICAKKGEVVFSVPKNI
ncbi:Competence protein ComGC [Streptococcus pneumoniae]|nr:Competence protein ComGC [Streptococcus pneumoniae]CGF78051.1 Competence protein ComGC [Streptococcus pneumoniae]CIZ87418.1 Competence protein ComGC [Streptococcus pneumoniae]CJA12751.1 Competence protein ComGC [Streptococcus pneumoniae]CJA48406.1 Competence protein ComGC [Streptococcus pneumoniae]